MSWDSEVDVVVLGTGGAGLTAALSAVAAGASVAVFKKAPTVGGTTAVSGGVVWIPAHNRSPEGELTEADALRYLRAQSLGTMDDALVETFVRTGPRMLEFVEGHSALRFEIAAGFPDYRPELPGGQPKGGRSLSAGPFDLSQIGEWGNRITSFPADWSNVGIDAETRARMHVTVEEGSDLCVAGTALIAGLLKGLLDAGVTPHTDARAEELIAADGEIIGVRIALADKRINVRARRGVVLGVGGFEWDPGLVQAFLRCPMHGAVSPPNNTGDGLRMAMAHGADLANMGEAWWVPIVQIPGDTIDGKQRSRSVRLERTRPRSIIVNQAGHRFVNEACDYNSMAGAFHYLDPRGGYVNDRGWIVFDATLSDPLTRAGLWIHGETVAPTDNGAPYAHGWASWFPPDGPPGTERFGPEPTQPAAGAAWFDATGLRVGPDGVTGRAGSLAWDLSWSDSSRPLWTFPRVAWERGLLPGAQVVIAPTTDFAGSLTVGGTVVRVDGWRGALAHIYGHGNAERWGWIHADLGDGDVLEVVSAVSRRPGLRWLAPLAFIRFRIDGKDWPTSLYPACECRHYTGPGALATPGAHREPRCVHPGRPARATMREPAIHRSRRGHRGVHQHRAGRHSRRDRTPRRRRAQLVGAGPCRGRFTLSAHHARNTLPASGTHTSQGLVAVTSL